MKLIPALIALMGIGASGYVLYAQLHPRPYTAARHEQRVKEQPSMMVSDGAYTPLLSLSGPGDNGQAGWMGPVEAELTVVEITKLSLVGFSGEIFLTVGPYKPTTKPPTWAKFHTTLPDTFEIQIEGGKTVTLGELRKVGR